MSISSVRVLVVEDSATMRAFLLAALESQGYEVVMARSGLEALKLLPKERFSVVITDVNMPDINGLELVRFLRESPQQKNTPFILISSDSRPRDKERGLQLGARHYLVKPIQQQELLDAVKQCLAQPGAA